MAPSSTRSSFFKEKAPPKPPKKTEAEKANEILYSYWGTSGLDRTLRSRDLRALKLKKDDIEDLLDSLPPKGTPGPTGQRIDECYRILERMV